MNKIVCFVFFSLVLISCATTTMTPEQRKVVDKIEDSYMECLGEKTAMYIKGSDDVQFLVKHILSQCDSYLSVMNDKLLELGFSHPFANGYIGVVRQRGGETTTSFILRKKSLEK